VAIAVAVCVGVAVTTGVAVSVGAVVFSLLPQANNTGAINASTSNRAANLYQEVLFLCLTTINLLHFHLGEPAIRLVHFVVLG